VTLIPLDFGEKGVYASYTSLKRPAVQYEGLYKHTWVHPTPELS
jgi:hypothetical protein